MRVLTIAGSDPSGGGGVQRDLATFAQLGVEGLSVVSCLTAQNTTGVTETSPVSGDFLRQQIETLLVDIPPAATKTGLLLSVESIEVVAALAPRLGPLVVDPVLGATSGQSLVASEVCGAMRDVLLPQATLVTPNLPEAAALTGVPVTDRESMLRAGQALLAAGAGAALLKGGHLEGDLVDILILPEGIFEFPRIRLDLPAVRGTGCALSAAIVAELACGQDVVAAVTAAGDFLQRALAGAYPLGQGAWHLGRTR